MLRRFLSVFFLLSALSSPLFAEATADSTSGGSFTPSALMLVVAIFFFYFILWRPEQKRRKAAEKTRSELAKGDKVTAMGIIGTVDQVLEHTVILNIASGKIEVLKAAVNEVLKPEKSKS
ncbi:preprotein translocase subunit YajC [Chlamydiifrater phoenicopteri]|uniref:preprotein translocase subunit YajC n=1 Tax=Chlamydiifrater phoenicopteri TaxID=2681469 RepID=UPI001BCDC3A6|nr:preprotein translocase subunit YajC [Chlamydiifrater phoenicopteri]